MVSQLSLSQDPQGFTARVRGFAVLSAQIALNRQATQANDSKVSLFADYDLLGSRSERSGESTHLLLTWLGFESQTQCHIRSNLRSTSGKRQMTA